MKDFGLIYKSKNITSRMEAVKCVREIVFLISLRSRNTLMHAIAVEEVTRQIYKLLAIENDKLEEIYLAAFCHDIGKIMTPVEILNKPDSLSFEEMEIMKEHVVHSGNILREFGLDEVARIAESHHEKLDGSGYPYGLKKEDLSLECRVLAVADIFSALTEERVYKNKFSKDRVINIFVDLVSKNKIDEDIVNLVIKNYDYLIKKIEKAISSREFEINYFIENYPKIGERLKCF